MAQAGIKRLGDLLVAKGKLTPEQLQESLIAKESSKLRIGQILVKKGYATEIEILEAIAEQYGFSSSPKIEFKDDEGFFNNIPVHFLHKNKMIPFKKSKKTIYVAIIDALNIQPLDDLKMIYPDYNLEPVLTLEDEVQKIIHTHFDNLNKETTDDVIEDLEESDFEILSNSLNESTDIMDMANDAPIIRLVNTIIKQAVNDRASDIHVEPYEKELIVRFRIDGILYQMFTPPKKYQGAVISRIKIMANLNIAENRLPQDGRIQLKISGKDIDIRVSIFPPIMAKELL